MKIKNMTYLGIVIISSLLLAGCGAKKEEVFFESDDNDTFFESVDEQANENIKISQEIESDKEFDVEYKTYEPDGIGTASFKTKPVEEIEKAGEASATEGMKLVLVEIAVKGNSDNSGKPSTFNQIGQYPSPQFVLIDKKNNISYVEETYYSDAYTQETKLFELSKITTDHEQWVNTAIVFEIESDMEPDLAFRFTNKEGEVEFYDILQN
jgi:hypothetical protein